MELTSLSLLHRLRTAEPDAPDWQRLHQIYFPLIHSWLLRVPGMEREADDLAQEVFVVLIRELPSFERQRDGSFRAWLRQISVNRIREFQRTRRRWPLVGGCEETEELLAQLEDSNSDIARQWDQDHDRHVFQKLLGLVQADFEPKTWQAFTRYALEGCPAAEVAQELAMSETAVVQAKFRILKRLREEAIDLMD